MRIDCEARPMSPIIKRPKEAKYRDPAKTYEVYQRFALYHIREVGDFADKT
jgi:hypothetical protein